MVAFAICPSEIYPSRTRIHFLPWEQCFQPKALLSPPLRVDYHLVLARASHPCCHLSSELCNFSQIFKTYWESSLVPTLVFWLQLQLLGIWNASNNCGPKMESHLAPILIHNFLWSYFKWWTSPNTIGTYSGSRLVHLLVSPQPLDVLRDMTLTYWVRAGYWVKFTGSASWAYDVYHHSHKLFLSE